MGREYVTANGVRLTLQPVRLSIVELVLNKLEQEWRERGEAVDPPKFPLSAIGVKVFGDEEGTTLDELDEETLATMEEMDAAMARPYRILWARYQKALKRLAAAKGELRTRTILRMGIKEEPPDDEWQRVLTEEGLAVEETAEGRKAQWLVHWALADPQDLNTVISEIYVLSAGKAVKPADVDLFRRSLQDSIRRGIKDSLDRAIEAAGGLGSESDVPGGRSGDGVGADAEPVGEAIG